MFGGYFYHERIRKSVAVFGRLFNNLYVVRKDASGGVLNQMKVPLSYAPKNKFLDRIREQQSLVDDTRVAIKLPRMSFEITDISYDLTRQLTKVSNFNTVGNTRETRNKFFSPVPYNLGFALNIFAKSQDDALQLVEQIVPTFNPQYSITIKPFSTEYPGLVEDIPVIIQSVSFSDDFEGAMEQRRTIIYSMDFEMKISYHGPIADTNVIRSSVASVFNMGTGLNDSDIGLQTITVTPNPTSVIGLADSDFGFTTTIVDSA